MARHCFLEPSIRAAWVRWWLASDFGRALDTLWLKRQLQTGADAGSEQAVGPSCGDLPACFARGASWSSCRTRSVGSSPFGNCFTSLACCRAGKPVVSNQRQRLGLEAWCELRALAPPWVTFEQHWRVNASAAVGCACASSGDLECLRRVLSLLRRPDRRGAYLGHTTQHRRQAKCTAL